MPIDISARFAFSLDRLSDVLLQFEAAAIPEQRVLDSRCPMSRAEHIARIAAQDGIGERIWLHVDGRFEVNYTARAEVSRMLADAVLRGNPGDVLGLAHLAVAGEDPLLRDRRRLELKQHVGQPVDREGEAGGNGDGHVPP